MIPQLTSSAFSALILWRLTHHRRWPFRHVTVYILAVLSLSWYTQKYSATAMSLRLSAVHFASLAVVTCIYRLSPFHPLASFPGPIVYKISDLTMFYTVATGYRFRTVDALHRKYGDFVRIGPNKLSIRSHSIQPQVYKSSRCLDKSLAYRIPDDNINGLFFLTNREAHGVRRAIWAPAFTQSMMDKYQPILENSVAQLIECIERRKDENGVVDLGTALQHWSFDFNAHFVFGNHSIDSMMAHGDPQGLVDNGQIATAQYEALGEAPWLLNILWHLPVSKPMHVLNAYAGDMIRKRKALGAPEIPDLCSFLLDEANELTEVEQTADAVFALQAGSDTTSAVLTYAFFHFLSNPSTLQRLATELRTAFPPNTPLTLPTLSTLPYLNAVVKEQLRLGTPFGNMPRVVPPTGMLLHGRWVPGGTVIGSPTYAMQVAAQYFPDPYAFKPERWLDGKGGADENALVSFQFGPFGCLGKQYAIREMLLVNAHLVRAFHLSFAPDFDPQVFEREVRNYKTTIFGKKLLVKVQPREA